MKHYMRIGTLMLNNKICLINEKKYTYHNPGDTASKVLIKHFENATVVDFIPDDLEFFLKSNNFDTVIFLNVPTLKPNIYEISQIQKTINVGVYFDDSAQYFHNWFRYLTQVIDFALCWEPVDVSLFESYGVPAAHIPGLFVTYLDEILKKSHVDWSERGISCIHIGRMDRPGRNSLQKIIERNFQAVEFWGDGTVNGYMPNNEYVSKLFNSKIAVNNSGCAKYNFVRKSDPIEWRRRQYKGKLFHYFLSKCAVLTQDSPIIENYFINGEDLLIYKDDNDLIDKLNYLIENPKIAFNIAQSGNKKALSYIEESNSINNFVRLLQRAVDKKNIRPRYSVYVDKYYSRSIAAFSGDEIISCGKNFLLFIKAANFSIFDFRIIKILARKILKKIIYE